MLKQSLHARALDRGPAPGGHVSEDVALLYADVDERVELELRILRRGADAGIAKESHFYSLPQKPRRSSRLRRFMMRQVFETSRASVFRGSGRTTSKPPRCLGNLMIVNACRCPSCLGSRTFGGVVQESWGGEKHPGSGG